MRALLFTGFQSPPGSRIRLADVPEPRLELPTDVLVEVEMAGLGLADVAMGRGRVPCRPPVVMGQEILGRVADVGSRVAPDHLSVGDRVVIDPDLTCEDMYPPSKRVVARAQFCPECQADRSDQCQVLLRGSSLGRFRPGGAARWVVAPQGALYQVPDEIDPRAAILAQPLSKVERALALADVKPGESVLILGATALGLLFLARTREMGNPVAVNDPDPFRTAMVQPLLGRPEWALSVSSRQRTLGDALREDVEGLSAGLTSSAFPLPADLVVDTLGTMLDRAVQLCRPGGRVLVVEMAPRAPPPILRPADLVVRRKSIHGLYFGKGFMGRALETLRQELPRIGPLVEAAFGLEEACSRGLARLGLDPATGAEAPVTAFRITVRP